MARRRRGGARSQSGVGSFQVAVVMNGDDNVNQMAFDRTGSQVGGGDGSVEANV